MHDFQEGMCEWVSESFNLKTRNEGRPVHLIIWYYGWVLICRIDAGKLWKISATFAPRKYSCALQSSHRRLCLPTSMFQKNSNSPPKQHIPCYIYYYYTLLDDRMPSPRIGYIKQPMFDDFYGYFSSFSCHDGCIHASKPPSRPFPFCAVLEPLEGPVIKWMIPRGRTHGPCSTTTWQKFHGN